MKKMYALFLVTGSLVSANLFSQTWTQVASLTTARSNAVAFSIGTKGYIATGNDGTTCLNDLWEYDQTANTWSQKANLPGSAREGAVAFTIGTKAYLGTGRKDTLLFRDFWEWNQGTNTWTQKTSFGGTKRSEACGFSVGTKGYIGTGHDGLYRNDFWQYDQGTNAWTPKANFLGGSRAYCMGYSLNNGKGYIASGYASGNIYQDLYQWDPGTSAWTVGVSAINYYAYDIACAAVNNVVYYGTGIDDNAVPFTTFSYWDPTLQSFPSTPFGGSARYAAVSFSIGQNVYIGTGFDGWVTNDVWVFTAPLGVSDMNTANSISVFPNPVQNDMQMTVGMWENKKADIQIYDALGKIVLTSVLEKQTSTIDVSSLAPGIYFLKYASGTTSSIKKFMKG